MDTATERSPWPAAIIATFVALAITNGFILYLALNSRSAPLDEKPYENGLAYEQIIAAKRAARRDAINPEITLLPEAVKIENLRLPGAEGWKVKLKLIRPDSKALDQELVAEGTGTFLTLPARPIKPGLWMVQLELSSGGESYYVESKIVL